MKKNKEGIHFRKTKEQIYRTLRACPALDQKWEHQLPWKIFEANSIMS